MNLKATVIIPTFDDWGSLQMCLDCLDRQSASPTLFEVIVANNNSSAEVPQSLRLPSNTRVIHAAKPGSYAARNAALREARGDVLFFTDGDCKPDIRWIEAGLARIADLGPHGRIAGAVELFPEGPNWTGPELYDRIHGLQQETYAGKGWGVTANLVVRRAAFDLVGPFDEDRFSGGDRDWNLRAQEMGCGFFYCQETLIRHPARASFPELAKKRRRTLGGRHHDELRGALPKRPLRHYLSFLSAFEIRRTLSYPGMTDWETVQVLWVAFRLGVVSFLEVARLRYLSGAPTRS
ncbi:glycosyltransferase [Tabrizicola sp.]|uniref:glycosyltransferase family 2 protein n=1 Tax=Tabrizicola sp. TaxID=2005166 RepID=UPI002637996F|nr:glycosyltransferase [Tabrizicola sp.]MDM7931801.1 glycosyltransferase [Tabrizicola sp.]